jgi:hypothetical protein
VLDRARARVLRAAVGFALVAPTEPGLRLVADTKLIG